MHEGTVSAELGIGGYPSIAESAMVARDLRIARYEDGRIHLQHLSTHESLEELAWARVGRHPRVAPRPRRTTCCSPTRRVRSLDGNVKMNPPLAAEADRQALIEAVRSGLVDCIATDHAPHAAEEKEQPFEQAPNGVTGLETAFAAILTGLVEPGVLPLATVVDGDDGRAGAGLRAARAAARGRAPRPTSRSGTSPPSGRCGPTRSTRAAPTAPSSAAGCAAAAT